MEEEGEGREDRGLALGKEVEKGRRHDHKCLRPVFQEVRRAGPNHAGHPSAPRACLGAGIPRPSALIHLEVCRSGPVLPAAQGIHGNRAAERAGALPVQPEAEALFTEHVLAHEDQRLPELSLADGTDITSFRALLPSGPDAVILRGAEKLQGFPNSAHTTTDVE